MFFMSVEKNTIVNRVENELKFVIKALELLPLSVCTIIACLCCFGGHLFQTNDLFQNRLCPNDETTLAHEGLKCKNN